MRRLLITVLALCLAGAALALETGGVRLDDKASVGGQELVLNGAGVRSRVVFKVYVASLYLPAKTTDPAAVLARAPRRIQMNMLRTLAPDQLVDALSEGLKENNSEAELAASDLRIQQARADYFPDLTLTGALGTESAAFSSLFSSPATFWRFGLALIQPMGSAPTFKAALGPAARSHSFRELASAAGRGSQSDSIRLSRCPGPRVS